MPDTPTELQKVLESSKLGRALISALVTVTLAAVVVSVLPASHIQACGASVLAPYLRATGLAQDWDVFAPDPARRTLYVSARIDFADGTAVDWRPPQGGRLIGPYRFYRWRKLATALQDDAYRETLWPSVARWLVDTHADNGRRPATVTFIRHWAPTPAPGSGDGPRWYEEPYYTFGVPVPEDDR